MGTLDLGPGTVFGGDFTIVRPLRVGGMGAVYVAEQRSTGAKRALKLMQRDLVADAGLRERFEQEARIGASIDSDHVVQVVGAGVDGATGIPWIAMELLRGMPLDLYLQQRGARPAGEVRFLFEQLCHALGAAHARGIVHRDLKPANVFLCTSRVVGLSYVVKVLDFGIAKVLAEAKTTKTAAVGTPLYMAPEQYEAGKVTPATDVWALGLIAFELLTGKSYWKAAHGGDATPAKIMYETCLSELAPPSGRVVDLGVRVALPAGFDEWFARCVERSPEARFPDANAAFQALATVLGASAPEADPLPDTVASDARASEISSAAARPPSAPTATLGPSTPREATRAMTEVASATPATAAIEVPRTELAARATLRSGRSPRNAVPLIAGAVVGAVILFFVTRAFQSTPSPAATEPTATSSPSASSAPSTTASAPKSASLAHFEAESTIVTEGRLLNTKASPGARIETYVMLDLHGADRAPATMAPVHLALVIDRSGSMKGGRLDNAITAAVTAIERLRDGDRVSVVTFDDSAQSLVPPTTLDAVSRANVVATVKKLGLGGNTCMSCGLDLALKELGTSPDWTRRVLLLSDGEANVGVRDVPGFVKIAHQAQSADVAITTIGVGNDYDPRALTALSRESNGQHHFAATESAIPLIFDAQAKALNGVVATNAEAVIDLAPGVELVSVLDRANRVEGSAVHVPLGQFTRGERKTVLLKVALTPGSDATKVAGVTVTFRDLLGTDEGKTTGTLTIASGTSSPEDLDAVVEARVRRSETAATLLRANELFEQGKTKQADDVLDAQVIVLEAQKKSWAARAVSPELLKDVDEQKMALVGAKRSYQVAVASAPKGVAPAAAAPAKAMAKKSYEAASAYGY